MEIVAKISKGSKMDQVYIPKSRAGMPIGSHVLISLLESKLKKEEQFRPYFCNVKEIEPIKLKVIEEIFKSINSENIIVTGSFLNRGFGFNDIDIILIDKKPIEIKRIEHKITQETGIIPHVIKLTSQELFQGISSDPLYVLMLSKFLSKKRIVFKIKRKLNYKLLDLHLLKSKLLTSNFFFLSGNKKFYLTRNMLAIKLFLENRRINDEEIEKEIKRIFGIEQEKIKQNLIGKADFLKKYEQVYSALFNKIMKGIKNAPK